MKYNTLDGKTLKEMITNATNNLVAHQDIVDELNVFPVPDGDTGTNMSLTIKNANTQVINTQTNHIGEVANVFSRGLLMGARGNSGVILSQLFRGFAATLKEHETANAKLLAEAFVNGYKAAYKAVMKPTEGTILTVARESADDLMEEYQNFTDLKEMFKYLLDRANYSLEGTPELLPVLKEVGVVDSGGAGLVYIIEGFYKYLCGEKIKVERKEVVKKESVQSLLKEEDITYTYCTEFVIRLSNDKENKITFLESRFKTILERLGDSIVVVQDEDIVKVHIHTDSPGIAMTKAQAYGEFVTIKIENMREQHLALSNDTVDKSAPREKYAIISVANGSGLVDLFKEVGCDYIIEGGQTMNPSTEDFINVIEKVHAENVIILPNNSNIIMAANQAKDVTTDCNVVVIPSKTIGQGYASALMFEPSASLEDNEAQMTEALSEVKSGQVTYAVRDTSFNGLEIKKDNFIAISEKSIVASTKTRKEAIEQLLQNMIDEDSEILTLIFGEDVKEKEANEVRDYALSLNEDLEVEICNGGQPVYSYILAVE